MYMKCLYRCPLLCRINVLIKGLHVYFYEVYILVLLAYSIFYNSQKLESIVS